MEIRINLTGSSVSQKVLLIGSPGMILNTKSDSVFKEILFLIIEHLPDLMNENSDGFYY
jgi:hypothetical protein